MDKRIISKKIIVVLGVVSVLLLLLSNIIFITLYKNAQNNINNRIPLAPKEECAPTPTPSEDDYHTNMPVSPNDYFQEPLSLVKNYKESDNPNTAYIGIEYYKDKKEVPFIAQNPGYPNGCEAVSATILLQSYGIDITVDEFVDIYLKKNVIYSEDGKRYGPNPKYIYAGDPTSATAGFGVFEPGIRLAIEKVLYAKIEDENFNVYGSEGKEPLSYQVVNKLPIIIWVTTDYLPAKEVLTWQSYNKNHMYTYPKKSHTIVVTGVDEEFYYINDPLKNEKDLKIEKSQLEASFDSMGRQVVRLELD